jgi:hypothetical protein
MHQIKAWYVMLGFFHFNPLQARLNKVKGEKHRTVKPSGFGLYSKKTFLVHEIIQSWALTLVPRPAHAPNQSLAFNAGLFSFNPL